MHVCEIDPFKVISAMMPEVQNYWVRAARPAILHNIIDSIQMAAKECFRFCHFLAKPAGDCLI